MWSAAQLQRLFGPVPGTRGASMILVVNSGAEQAANLKSLIEFMDTPEVLTANPGDWRERVGDQPIEALFVGADLSATDIDELLNDIGSIDPNIPIVMLTDGDSR